MRKILIAFDVDGTLRCNCTDTCQDINDRQFRGLAWLGSMKNTNIMIWSGGGAEYARQFIESSPQARAFGAIYPGYLNGVHYASKFDQATWKWGRPDIAIDDMHSCELGIANLIVWEK